MPSKITGTPIATFNGLKIYAALHTPKKKGKQRIWISIRQDVPKDWKIAASLSYVNSIDIRFEK
jgi:acyl-CoA thioesterase